MNEPPNGGSSHLLFIIICQIFDEQTDIITLSVEDAIDISSILTAAVKYKIILKDKITVTAENVIREVEWLAYLGVIFKHIRSINYTVNSACCSCRISELI